MATPFPVYTPDQAVLTYLQNLEARVAALEQEAAILSPSVPPQGAGTGTPS